MCFDLALRNGWLLAKNGWLAGCKGAQMAGYELGTAEIAGFEIRMIGWSWYEAQRWLADVQWGVGGQRFLLRFNNPEKKGRRIARQKTH